MNGTEAVINSLYAAPFLIGRSGKNVATGSLSSRNNLRVLAGLLAVVRPERSLEVGLALGASALTFAEFQRSTKAAPTAQHVAIDPFQDTVWDDCGLLALEQAGLKDYCAVVNDFSASALARLVSEGSEFGLIYIDGSHLFEDVFVDIFFCARLVSLGGILLIDDASDPHVSKALRFVRRNMTHVLREVDLGRFRAETSAWASLKYGVARRLDRVQLAAFERVGDPARAWDAPLASF